MELFKKQLSEKTQKDISGQFIVASIINHLCQLMGKS